MLRFVYPTLSFSAFRACNVQQKHLLIYQAPQLLKDQSGGLNGYSFVSINGISKRLVSHQLNWAPCDEPEPESRLVVQGMYETPGLYKTRIII